MNISIADLEINPRIKAAIRKAGFHDGRAVLNVSSAELERQTALSAGDVAHLKDAIAEAVLGHRALTGLQMWQKECCKSTRNPRLSTGCPLLDQALRGGVLLGGITEVSGESASGKTQLCLQLCLTVQLPLTHGGLDGGALYICTEGAFPNKRLSQMAGWFSQRHSSVVKHPVMDRVLLEHVAELEGLSDCLQKKVPIALAQRRLKLLVVDSVAALFRADQEGWGLRGRAKHLARLAMQLRRLAEQHGIAVICVNQVTANMSKVCDGPDKPRESVPALGLVWADHVTCRLFMSRASPEDPLSTTPAGGKVWRSSSGGEEEEEEGGFSYGAKASLVSRRRLEVVFAPHLARRLLPLVIDQRGIRHEGAGEGVLAMR